jgi:nitric oxide reductase activation protein
LYAILIKQRHFTANRVLKFGHNLPPATLLFALMEPAAVRLLPAEKQMNQLLLAQNVAMQQTNLLHVVVIINAKTRESVPEQHRWDHHRERLRQASMRATRVYRTLTHIGYVLMILRAFLSVVE